MAGNEFPKVQDAVTVSLGDLRAGMQLLGYPLSKPNVRAEC
jgi:hypothetical protein